VSEQFLNAVLGNRQVGLDGLTGLDGLGAPGQAMGI
jgi:hypothetical protein